MKLLQTTTFQSVFLAKDTPLELIDIFDVKGKKTIELESNSFLTYLVIGSDIDIHIVTKWSHCGCKIFGLFASDKQHSVSGSLKVSLNNSATTADVELFSFLHDGATFDLDGSIDIGQNIDHVHGRLFEHTIVLWKNISIKTSPALMIASHDVHASHGATLDLFDQQKAFYMMSRGLSQQQTQTLLMNWYIDYVLGHFARVDDATKSAVYTKLMWRTHP